MSITWQRIGYRLEACSDETGRILGEVEETLYRFAASANEKHIGDYITDRDAKRAVERALKPSALPSPEAPPAPDAIRAAIDFAVHADAARGGSEK